MSEIHEIDNAGLGRMTDAAFDEHFPRQGPCCICGCKDLDGRHRLLDAIVDRALGGDTVSVLAGDYARPEEAIREVFRRHAWFRPGRTIRRKPHGRGCKVLRLDFNGHAKALVKDLSRAQWVYLTTLGKKWKP